jgi:hypothetical protein
MLQTASSELKMLFSHQRNGHQQLERPYIRSKPVWKGVLRGGTRAHDVELAPLVESLWHFQVARIQKDPNEAWQLISPLARFVSEGDSLANLSSLAPEQRLKVFDELVRSLNAKKGQSRTVRHSALALLARYLATVAAVGTPTLSLAESQSSQWPEISVGSAIRHAQRYS